MVEGFGSGLRVRSFLRGCLRVDRGQWEKFRVSGSRVKVWGEGGGGLGPHLDCQFELKSSRVMEFFWFGFKVSGFGSRV